MRELLDIIDGRKVAIVGNNEVDKDYSAEIDKADVVIRFNHFYNYDSGRVGKRVDVIVQTFTTAWEKAENKHVEVIKAQKPKIFCAKKPQQFRPIAAAGFFGGDICVSDLSADIKPFAQYTTGTAFLAYLAKKPRNATFRVYGFSSGADADKYFSGDAKHYANIKQEELMVREGAIEMLERMVIHTPRKENKPHIVIPVKLSSSGAPGKCRALLPRCIEELKKADLPITVIGNDDELLDSVKEKYGVEVFRSPTNDVEEPTNKLRLWRDAVDYHGEVVLAQCTAPQLKAEWVQGVLEARKHAPVSATCVKVNFKVNAIYSEQNGVYVPLAPQFGPPSVPRQQLPSSVRLSGALWAFHSDALDRKSFYMAGTMAPYIVEEEYALDVDTKQDLEKALKLIEEEKK